MSRVGKEPVTIPKGVEVSVSGAVFTAKGSKGEQTVPVLDMVELKVEDGSVTVVPQLMTKRARQNWGTTRALINNAVVGASEGFTRRLDINGVGYRAAVQGNILKLSLGFSHDVDFPIPEDVTIAVEGDRSRTSIVVSGAKKR